MEKIKNFFLWIRKKGMYIMIISFVLSLVALFTYTKTDIEWLGTLGWILLAIASVFMVIGLIYAWVINPLRERKLRKQ